jgi:type II secretory pathway component PulL
MNQAHAERRRRLRLWNRWLVMLLVAGFVLFSAVFSIVLMFMAR